MGWNGVGIGLTGGRRRRSVSSAIQRLLFAEGSDGLLLDFKATDGRIFQTSNGGAVAVAAGENIGLIVSSHTWAGKKLGAMLGAAVPLASWAMSVAGGGSVAIEDPAGSGILTLTGDGTNQARADKNVALAVGQHHCFEFDVEQNACSLSVGTAQGSGNYVSNYNASVGSHRVFFSATQSSNWFRLFRTSGLTTVIRNGRLSVVSNHFVRQGTSTARGLLQAGGWQGDGADDRLATDYTCGPAGNCMVAKVTVAPSISSPQLIAGATDAGTGSPPRFYCGFGTDGVFVGGVGSQVSSTIRGGVDRRGQTLVVGISCDGQTVKLFEDVHETYVAPQVGAVTSAGFSVGSGVSGPSTPSNWFSGQISKLVVGRRMLTLADFLAIRAELLALP